MNKSLLKKYIKGECNPQEVKHVVAWIQSEKFDQDLLVHIEDDLNQAEVTPVLGTDQYRKAKVLQQVYDRDGKANEDAKSTSSYPSVFLKIAASVLLLFLSTYLIFDLMQPDSGPQSEAAQMVIKENDRGRKSTLFLPDGSIVYLNSESSVRYDEYLFDSIRLVYLKGEAFFEVARDTVHPFRVISDQVEVTALGTSFNVSSYQESETTVALNTGKVLVKKIAQATTGKSELVLNPGQQVSYLKDKSTFSKIQPFSPQATFGWKDGILYFDQADLSSVLTKLERWYDVEFEIVNSQPYKWRYSAQYHNQSLKNVLESLSFSQNFKYELNGKTVIIEFSPG
ncbi:MAG: FecR family protein [Candidatus Cyclobacteriaceae bacterium M3_2C_046]